ncbi:MAG: S8 family serine peptidase [Bacteroidota bacterium]|nr:S8 family serine peptidase [Bacteroidota bacterium]
MLRIIPIAILTLTYFSSTLSAQRMASPEADILSDQVIVKAQSESDVQHAIEYVQKTLNLPSLQIKDFISPVLPAWTVSFDANEGDVLAVIKALHHHPSIDIAQGDHVIEYRDTEPDDALYGDQWQYVNSGGSGGVPNADLDAELAWDITTGGFTANGDEIVVAVIDDGVELSHPDWGDNLWTNEAEIPNNNIDDDGNGYTDDYRGWSAYSNDDNVGSGGSHGTPVAGIIGAQGNNGVGVTGVNWDVKVMIIEGGSPESRAIASYSYALVQRKRYNDTQGAEGAFVVSTNSSWGIDYGQPASAPMWCAMYDSLGAYGIISAGATINGNVNVDIEGDLPTACASEYLISVTNLGRNDIKVNGAGYGATTIDLGAYGQETYTLDQPGGFGGEYGGFGGTSGATPHVAGTIALMYSVDCPAYADLALENPADMALDIKDMLLEGVTPNTSLSSNTVTGGRLNMYGAVEAVNAQCPRCSQIPEFFTNIQSSNTLQVSFFELEDDQTIGYFIEYRLEGDSVWNEFLVTSDDDIRISFLENLFMAGSTYEIRVRTACQNNQNAVSAIRSVTFDPSSIEDNSPLLSLLVSPNPSNGLFTIGLEEVGTFHYTVTDTRGREILSGKLVGRSEIDAFAWSKGMYFLTVFDREGGLRTTLPLVKN